MEDHRTQFQDAMKINRVVKESLFPSNYLEKLTMNIKGNMGAEWQSKKRSNETSQTDLHYEDIGQIYCVDLQVKPTSSA